ncbi:hypothetical protein MMYC01_204689 [Madurella mycetomatis]|uniref:Uncharacterized protein n=1 Tax=Madurella mycetomatis TaxID=100816 RepID=A0A175WAS0_9PEZI|nr:hypothetical protein MMYC01_204689 [Madurella mycetomatis]
MKSLTTLLLAAAGFVQANGKHGSAPPRLSILFTANVTATTPIVIGDQPAGTRIAYPFTGGTFTGPRLNGTLLPVGADFSILRPGNQFSSDGIAVLQTSDGANILFKDLGHQSGDFVYGSATFETGAEEYRWINTVIAISRARVSTEDTGGSVELEVFVVE